MFIEFRPMKEIGTDLVASTVKEMQYSFYDEGKLPADLEDLMQSGNFDFFVAVSDTDDILGFIECMFDDDDILEMGCALLPEYAGKGDGFGFVSGCVEFLLEHYDYAGDIIKTILKHEDEHSIRVYERVGFAISDETENWIELEIAV